MSRRTVVAAIGVAAVAVGGAVGGVFAVTGPSSTHSGVSLSANSHRAQHPREMRLARGWSFSKLNNSNDPTFNQLLGINNRGDVAGFYTGRGGVTRGFLLGAHGHLTRLTVPGASSTMAFGVNDQREVVGTYMTGSGSKAKSFGFVWSRHFGFRTVNDPHGRGATTLNGINDAGDLVGFYTDAKGNTDGLLVARGHFRAPLAPPVTTTPAPAPTPTVMPTPTTTPTPVPTGVGPTHF